MEHRTVVDPLEQQQDGVEGGGIDWRAVWPLPVLVAAALLLAGGLATWLLTAPEPDAGAPLREARGLIEQEQFAEALEVLNEDALGFVQHGLATPEQVREFYRARAEALYRGQAAMGISRRENHERILKNYEQAAEIAGESGRSALPPADVERIAMTLLALDRPESAAEQLEALPGAEDAEDGGARRRRIVRSIVEYNLSAPNLRRDSTLKLLAMLSADPQLPLEDRLWSAAREAELRLEEGAAAEAVLDLLREIQLLDGAASPTELAELHLLLARGYFEQGRFDGAEENAAIAEAAYADPARGGAEGQAAAIVLRGRISQAVGELEAARERFERVRSEFGGTEAHLASVLGLAETEAQLGNDETAMEAYAEVVDRSRRGEAARRRDVTPERVAGSLMARHAERYLAGAGDDGGQYRTALAYAQLAESVFADEDVPPQVLLALADTHRRLAEQLLSDEAGARLDHRAIRRMDPVTQSQAKFHLLEAGRYYLAHADEVLLASNGRYLDSLWLAADSLDLGGALEDAAAVFGRYYDGASPTDQRRPEARFRLAQIFQAKREYQVAAPLYLELIENRPGETGAAKGVGRWADASVVPLAQCYLADEEPENDAAAAALLRSVVEGSVLSPDALEFREALLELAALEYRQGRYAEAVRLFDEAVKRYPDDERLAQTKYRLADSYRLLAAQIGESLREAMPTSERQEREGAQREALGTAKRLYEQVQRSLGAEGGGASAAGASAVPMPDDGQELTPLERLQLRNAAFYIGDCAFDMGDYEEAIRAYGEAAERYARDPSSLVAKVQIVNAYVAMKQWDNARTAQERARQHYVNLTQRFGDEVWDDPTLPMEQKHWERWLSAGRQLDSPRASAGDG